VVSSLTLVTMVLENPATPPKFFNPPIWSWWLCEITTARIYGSCNT
jgi:hypothetical protein